MRDQGWVLLTGRDGNFAWARINLQIVPTCPVPGRVTRNKTVLYMCGGNPGRRVGFAAKVYLLSQESIDVFVVDAAYNFNILDDDFFQALSEHPCWTLCRQPPEPSELYVEPVLEEQRTWRAQSTKGSQRTVHAWLTQSHRHGNLEGSGRE